MTITASIKITRRASSTSSTITIDAAVGPANPAISTAATGAYATFSHHISELVSCKHSCSAYFKRFEL